MKNNLLFLFAFLVFANNAIIAENTKNSFKENPPTSNYGNIVWYNLVTPNIETSKKFYGNIFDWTFTDINSKGQKFAIIKHNDIAIGSMLEIANADASIWLASISVNNIKEAITRYTKNGGRLLIEPFNVMKTGEQVILEGPDGEKIAYINNPASPVSTINNGPNQWIWTELWSNNPAESKLFYEKVWNVEVSESEVKGNPYWYFEKDAKKVAGMIKNPAEGTKTQWVPYVNITDINKLHQKLKDQNVNIMLAPKNAEKGAILVFQDPNGATLCVQNYAN